jgi:hypothetical protein
MDFEGVGSFKSSSKSESGSESSSSSLSSVSGGRNGKGTLFGIKTLLAWILQESSHLTVGSIYCSSSQTLCTESK